MVWFRNSRDCTLAPTVGKLWNYCWLLLPVCPVLCHIYLPPPSCWNQRVCSSPTHALFSPFPFGANWCSTLRKCYTRGNKFFLGGGGTQESCEASESQCFEGSCRLQLDIFTPWRYRCHENGAFQKTRIHIRTTVRSQTSQESDE